MKIYVNFVINMHRYFPKIMHIYFLVTYSGGVVFLHIPIKKP